VLFIELAEAGSTILTYSALKECERKFGRENMYFLIFSRNREAIELLNTIPAANILTIDDSGVVTLATSTLRALWQARFIGFKVVVDLELFSRFSALLAYFTRAPRRIGFHNLTAEGLYRGRTINGQVAYNPHQHMVHNFLNLAVTACEEELPAPPAPKRAVAPLVQVLPRLTVSAQELEDMRDRITRLAPNFRLWCRTIILNPDPGVLSIRGWPVENFKRLAGELTKREDVGVLVVGLDRGRALAREILAGLNGGRTADLTGLTRSFRELAAVFHLGDVLVTNDSGPAHIAAMTPIYPVVLFGPETPALYSPQASEGAFLSSNLGCSPCLSAANHRRTRCNNNRCLQLITVEDVLRSVDAAMSRKPLQVAQNGSGAK
jgi:ADP-heptose:LPS heptosyltransferase